MRKLRPSVFESHHLTWHTSPTGMNEGPLTPQRLLCFLEGHPTEKQITIRVHADTVACISGIRLIH